ncbi:MAG: hypothetical protein R2792_16415 [Saprospiraceae bacterium]
MKLVLTLSFFLSLLAWTKHAAVEPEVPFVANSNMNIGSSVEGMLCPDPTLTWPCSITSEGSSGNAPPPAGCPAVLEKNASGQIVIRLQKSALSPSLKSAWFNNNTFNCPQEIEIERQLSIDVFQIDAATYIDPGSYPVIETATTFEIII